jgi:hypothetical protein
MKSVILALAVLLAGHVGAQTLGDEIAHEHANFLWKCKGTGRDSMQCTIQNKSDMEEEICVDVVKVCKDGDHIARMCSGLMKSGEIRSKVVHDFRPKVKFFAGCMGVEYRNRFVQ